MANVYFKLEKATIGVGGFKSLIVEVTPADDLLIGVQSDDVKLNKEGKKVVALSNLRALLQPLHDAIASSVPGSEPTEAKALVATELDEDLEDDEPELKPTKKAKAEKPVAKSSAKKKKEEDEEDDDTDDDDDLGDLDDDDDEKPAKKSTKKEAPVAKKPAKKPAKEEDDDDIDDLADLLAD